MSGGDISTILVSFIISEIVFILFSYWDDILAIYVGNSEHPFYQNTYVMFLQQSLGE